MPIKLANSNTNAIDMARMCAGTNVCIVENQGGPLIAVPPSVPIPINTKAT